MGSKQPEGLELSDLWFHIEIDYFDHRKTLNKYWNDEIEAILDNNLMDLVWKEIEHE